MENNCSFYNISQIVLITGLTDRTIRNYVADGILEGEKVNGAWRFTPEQLEAFIVKPEVRQSIISKNKSIVYDFLSNEFKKENEACIILDLPNADHEIIIEQFALKINNGSYTNINFSFDGNAKTPRIILRGKIEDVLEITNGYANVLKHQ